MIDPSTFRRLEFLTSVFTPGLQFVPARILPAILNAGGANIDSEPLSLPLEGLLPIEVPRIILQGQAGAYRVQIGPSRLDIIWSAQQRGATLVLSSHLEWVSTIIEAYTNVTRATVGRLACGTKRVSPLRNSGVELARHFCKDRWLAGPLNRPEDFQLHAYKRFVMADAYTVNSWVKCLTTRLTGEAQEHAILIDQDLNTPAENVETNEFTAEQIHQFFATCPRELDHIFNLYFPSEPL
jgi:hypothetical protein